MALPTIKKRIGQFSVSVFEETKQGKTGEYISRSVVLQKSYKDQNDQWQRQTINLFDNNVYEVASLLQAVGYDLMSTEKPTTQVKTVDISEIDDIMI